MRNHRFLVLAPVGGIPAVGMIAPAVPVENNASVFELRLEVVMLESTLSNCAKVTVLLGCANKACNTA